MPIQLISYLQDTGFDLYNMREWLSGGAPPCQGGGRGFDPRLALGKKNDTKSVSFFFSSPARARKFDVYAPLRSALLSNKFCVSQYLCLIVQWVT